MDAVIYAAGRATRLGPEFAQCPKILLEVGGRSLLEWHALRLAAAGVRNLFVVTGHCREQIARVLPKLGGKSGLRAYELHNPDFTEGSVISMHVSLSVLENTRGPVLVMDGDVIYNQELIRRVVHSRYASAMLLDFGYRDVDDDPVLVPIRNGLPRELLKKWRGKAERVAESIGFFKVSPEHLPLLAERTRARLKGLKRRDSLDEVLRDMTKAGVFGFEDVTGLPWTEIDFPHDLEYARNEVVPRLKAKPDAATRSRA